MPDTKPTSDIAALTVQLLSAYLVNNTVGADDLAGLIRSTRAALTEDTASTAAEPEAPTYEPAVSVRKSLASDDQIISLIDGKPYKALKRHLTSHGLTPEQYRERYSLPATYPMVAPGFAAQRREIAKKIGLSNRKATVAATTASTSTSEALPASAVDAQAPGAEAANGPAPATAPVKGKQTITRKPRKILPQEAMADSGASVAAASNAPAEDPEAVAPKKRASVKSKGGTPPAKASAAKESAVGKPKTARKAREVKPSNAPAESPKSARKGRGKLGLFNRQDTEPKGDMEDTSPPATSDKAAGKTEGKPPRSKRMARTPKTAKLTTGGGNDR
ncbi:MucR family transcriptional regulator [Novosphingobium kaempferiae]|uniref:MucR family transcriptional regulator n=1 Tax=Novosphingobium kaempferiae TaxID=2896849 RepID=UPI001E31EB58|nr:MucR family transcriptional regulator [Novosphingobium kaempferiae]